ncbi:MAG: hypothetical protein ACOX6T_12205 [Myxococcales bacterium]|jgi:putative membrane protein
MYFVTPLGALFRGMVAGAIGAYAQNVFFKRTAKIAPPTPEGVFTPPEEEQKREIALETTARRFTEGMMKRGPLTDAQKKRGATLVHYAFGAMWGGLYGLTRETLPATRNPLGVAAYSAAVWMLADNVVLPAFKLAAWPQKYPLKTHAYALAAHFAYGTAIASSYETMRRQFWDAVGASLWAFGARRKVLKRLPVKARPAARMLIKDLAWVYANRPIERVRAVTMH